jgi:regulator of protease activity HflC (stomatin/prohibitin superfamily)
MKKGFIGGIILAVILIIGVIVVGACLEKVDAGYVGVVYNMNGGVEDKVLSQGWHFVSPTKKVTPYTIGLEQSYLTEANKGDSKKDESFNIPTSDGKTVKVDLEFSYRFDEERVSSTFVMFKGRSGEEIKNTFIKPKIVAWTQEVSANYPVTDIFGDKRTKINAELDVYLREKFAPYGIIIDTVNFTNISVDDETAQAIQKKVTAQQELELAEIEAKTALIQAQKDKEVALKQAEAAKEVALKQAEANKEVARINAEQALIKANAEAEAQRIAAEAEAEANRMIAESITDKLIEKTYADNWNGEYPQVVGSDTTILKGIG